ncbi:MAG: hypothetical protein V3V03_01155 [Hyphomonadaceae bacterium]
MLYSARPILKLCFAFLLAACTATGPIVDVPYPIQTDYAVREKKAMKDDDRCGPEFIQENLSASLLNSIGPLVDGPFRPVCRRHDACYRLEEKTQSWCDDRMYFEMHAICDADEVAASYDNVTIGRSLCRFRAGLYYAAINNTYGSLAYGGEAGGEIADLRVRRLETASSSDQLSICVDVLNSTKAVQEYDVELHTSEGKLVDREPDFFELNIRAGEHEEICVGTNGSPFWNIDKLTDTVHVSVRADTPGSFAFRDDMVIVDVREVEVPR